VFATPEIQQYRITDEFPRTLLQGSKVSAASSRTGGRSGCQQALIIQRAYLTFQRPGSPVLGRRFGHIPLPRPAIFTRSKSR